MLGSIPILLPMGTPSLREVRLYRMNRPEHPCPWGLRAVRLLQERHIPFEDHHLRNEEEAAAFKTAHGVSTTPQVFAGPERIGSDTDLAARMGVEAEATETSYAPVIAVFSTAALMNLLLDGDLHGLMGSPSVCWRCSS